MRSFVAKEYRLPLMSMKKAIPLLMALVLLCSLFAACEPTVVPEETSAEPTVSEEKTEKGSEESTTSGEEQDTLPQTEETGPDTSGPAQTIGGGAEPPYEFSLAGITREYPSNPRTALERELIDLYNAFEDKNNVKIKIAPLPLDKVKEILTTSHQTKIKVADFVKVTQWAWGPAALKGMLRPLNTAEVKATGLDVDDPEMFDQMYTQLSVLTPEKNEKIWGVAFSGKYFISEIGFTYVFNKRILESFGYSAADMYRLVDEGEWTWQKFISICKEVTANTDSQGSPIIWGQTMMDGESELATNVVNLMNYNTATRKWESGFNKPELQSAVYFYFTCSLEQNICLPEKVAPNNTARRQMFYDGKAAFACLAGSHYGPDGVNVRAKDNYGILPVPMGGPGTQTLFGTQNGIAQEKGKNLPTKGYKQILPDLNVFVLQTVNSDWAKSAEIMSKLGEMLTDPAAADSLLLTYFRGDRDSLRIMKNYLLPTVELQSTRYSLEIKAALDLATREIVVNNGMVTSFASAHDILQAAIDKTFGYK